LTTKHSNKKTKEILRAT